MRRPGKVRVSVAESGIGSGTHPLTFGAQDITRRRQRTARRSRPLFACKISICDETANDVPGAGSHPPGTGDPQVIDVPIEPQSVGFDRAIGIAEIFFRKQNAHLVAVVFLPHIQQHGVEILVSGLDLLRRNRGAVAFIANRQKGWPWRLSPEARQIVDLQRFGFWPFRNNLLFSFLFIDFLKRYAQSSVQQICDAAGIRGAVAPKRHGVLI